MAWTASIVQVEKAEGGLVGTITVDFTNGTLTNRIPFRISDPSSLKRIITTQIKQYQDIDAFAPPIGTVDLTVPPIVPPTQAELDRAAFIVDLQTLRQMDKAVQLGLILSSSAPYTNLVAKIRADYKPAYLVLL